MPGQAPGTLLSAFGSGGPNDAKNVLCMAFASAVERWCSKRPSDQASTKGKEFADVFFEELREGPANPQMKALSQSLAGEIQREAPVLTKAVSGEWKTLGTLGDVAKVGSGDGGLARELAEGLPATSGATEVVGGWARSFRMTGNNQVRALGGGEYRLRYPDGVLPDGQLMEIKGPGDKWRPGQAESYNQASQLSCGRDVASIDCGSCPGANCTPGKRCR